MLRLGWVPQRTTSARLLVKGNWYSTSTSISVRPASRRSGERTSRLFSHERISAGGAERPSWWRYWSASVDTRELLSIFERRWVADPRNSGTSQPQEA